MNPALLAILRSLRDIDGVLGSFIWLADGRVLASDMPEHCSLGALEAVAARMNRLTGALGDTRQFETATLGFAQVRLHVCGEEGGFVASAIASHVNMSALTMAATLALRDLAFALTEPVTAASLAPRAAAPVGAEASGRSYRGHRVPGRG